MVYNLNFDAGALFRALNTQLKHAMAEALEQTAQTVQGDWQETILRQRGMYQPYKDRYTLSVKYEVDRNNLTARIFSDDPMATPFETGEPARDLKQMLNTSLKTRVVKNGPHAGQRYMVISFRHNTPGHNALAQDMPRAIYKQAGKLEASSVKYMSFRKNQLGVYAFSNDARTHQLIPIRSRSYNWGGRLGNGPDIPKQLRGMVRFDTSSGKKKNSEYRTFRVMTEWSNGWIVAAKPGRYLVKGVADRAQEVLTFNVQNAIASVAGV